MFRKVFSKIFSYLLIYYVFAKSTFVNGESLVPMSDKHLKTDNLKPISTSNKRKVKKIKCYEMYIFYNEKGEAIDEEIIRELTPKVVKSKHSNRKWNSTLSNNINQMNNTKPNKLNLKRTLLSKQKTVTRISPYSMSRNNDVRRSPTHLNFKKNYQNFLQSSGYSKDFPIQNSIIRKNSHINDPVKIMPNHKERYLLKHNYGKYPKTYVKTTSVSNDVENLNKKEITEIKKSFENIPPSAVSYGKIGRKRLNFISSVVPNEDSLKEETLSQENCIKIQTFAKSFNIMDVQDWVHKNCLIAQMYISNASCDQINHLIDSCYNKKKL